MVKDLAIKEFQKQFGIKDDGIVGPVTLYAQRLARESEEYNLDAGLDPKLIKAAQVFEKVYKQSRDINMATAVADHALNGRLDDKSIKLQQAVTDAPVMKRFSVYGDGDTALSKGTFEDKSWLERSIRHLEGFHSKPTFDGHRAWDIGPGVPRHGPSKERVTEKEGYDLLQGQIGSKLKDLDRIGLGKAFRSLRPHQQDALMCFAYNNNIIGDDFRKSDLYKAIKHGDEQAITEILPKWNKAEDKHGKHVIDKGLDMRRKYEARLFAGEFERAFEGDPERKWKLFGRDKWFKGFDNWKKLDDADVKCWQDTKVYYSETARQGRHSSSVEREEVAGLPATELPRFKTGIISKDRSAAR